MSSQPDKIRVAVLYGGRSAEHEVSVRSAANVIQFLDTARFEIIPIGIDKQGNWFLGHEIFTKSLEQQHIPKKLQEDTRAWFTPEWIGKPANTQQDQSLAVKKPNGAIFDVVFPVVHGTLCEDGTLQGLLELTNIPYVGCGVLSSAIGMDKDVSKRLASGAGIRVAPYIVVKHERWQSQPQTIYSQVAEKLSYPVFVKPANTGSSIGISKVKSADQLQTAMDEAFQFDTKVLIEKGLNVVELEVAVLESLQPEADPIVSVVGEVRPRHEFYSYDAKYIDENGAELIIPALISEQQILDAQKMAQQLFIALECEGMARVDLFLDKDTQQIYFNEINTLPGFTQISMYPKLMGASGMAYSDLLTHLIQLAIKRHKNKSQLIRSYAG
jgi:D-alanine-D-alanine ligase